MARTRARSGLLRACPHVARFVKSYLIFSLTAISLASFAVADSLDKAIQLLAEEKYQAAQQILEDILRSSGESAPAQVYYHLAVCYLQQGNWKKAEDSLNAFLQFHPQDLSAIYLKAYILFRTSRYEESFKLLLSYIEKRPDHASAHKILGLNHFMLGKSQAAEAELKRAIELAPQDWEAHYFLGRIYFTENNLLSALAAFKKAIELDPSSVKAHNHLGQTYEALSHYRAAREAYLKAIELERKQAAKSEWPYFNLGVLCIREGRTQEAIEHLRQALARNPSWAECKVKLAVALSSAGKHEEALSQLADAIRLEPQNAEARYRLAQLLIKMGKQEEAQQQLLIFEKLNKP